MHPEPPASSEPPPHAGRRQACLRVAACVGWLGAVPRGLHAEGSPPWQTEDVRRQARDLLQRWHAGVFLALDDEALVRSFRALAPEVLATALALGASQHEGLEIWMKRQERIHGRWSDTPFLNHIKYRRQPRQVYMAWLPGGPKAGQEILYDARRRPDAMYGHLGGAFNVMSIWTALDGSLARDNSNHSVLDLSPRFIADVVAAELQRYRAEGRSPQADSFEVLTVAGQRCLALGWTPPSGPPAHYAARTRICLNLRQPWVLQVESWDAGGDILERILFDKIVPATLTDADFDPGNAAYRF
jgi:Protein of unknown function (DUF1571)